MVRVLAGEQRAVAGEQGYSTPDVFAEGVVGVSGWGVYIHIAEGFFSSVAFQKECMLVYSLLTPWFCILAVSLP
jgi:hypothetical protein